MIEFCVQPVVGPVTSLTGGGEFCGDVVGIGGRLEISRVAGITLSGHRLEMAGGRTLVAGIAIHGGVPASQRKTVVVLLNLLHRNLPASDRVALLTVRP